MDCRSALFSLALLAATPAVADDHAGMDPQQWRCMHQGLERQVGVVYETDGPVPCAVQYDKPTEGQPTSYPWRANNEAGYCEARAKEFVAKLEGWGWACSAVGAEG